jgi:hypothetical protein
MQHEHDDRCQAGDDDHVVTVNIDYLLEDDEDGDTCVKAAGVHSHIHGVPHLIAAQTLLVLAQNMIKDFLAHEAFEGCTNHELRHAMAEAAAPVYMKQLIDDMPTSVSTVDFAVPNDLSELLGEE